MEEEDPAAEPEPTPEEAEEEEIMAELKQLIKTRKTKGKDAMSKKFDKMAKAYERKHSKELNEMNRLVQVYYENEQWALLDKTLDKINTWTTMISKQLENKEMEC